MHRLVCHRQVTHTQLMHTVADSRWSRPEYPVTYNPAAGYATGWFESTYRDWKLQQHGGSMGGYTSHMSLLPDVGAGVYVAINLSPDAGDAKGLIVMHVLDLLLGTCTVCYLLRRTGFSF